MMGFIHRLWTPKKSDPIDPKDIRISELTAELAAAERALEEANLIRYWGREGIFFVERGVGGWDIWRQHSAGSDCISTSDSIVGACQEAKRLSTTLSSLSEDNNG
jgi:hypothetical protein